MIDADRLRELLDEALQAAERCGMERASNCGYASDTAVDLLGSATDAVMSYVLSTEG